MKDVLAFTTLCLMIMLALEFLIKINDEWRK